MQQYTTFFKKSFLILLFLLSLAGGIGSYNYLLSQHTDIVSYQPQTDREFILNLFKENWYWLVSEYSTDFSAEYMLDNRASSKDPFNKNNLTIKVYHVDHKPVGFVAYYKKTFFKGFILFLAVDEQCRKIGCATKLLSYAIKDLFNRGCSVIELITRVSNISAQSLYHKLGFKEFWRDEDFVRFELSRHN